ncbi:uncharacterized protein RHOBADRAFT_66670 [Rhodotorula graminis WP1]|uniref:non-specific serine/threonine protein kinase n=1 Tax=Rhodotorula graminis (strain WP1) TaxID=578459 RepID=A0A0P9IVQ7_RHOGW|nr:uncharacterized protein RHOBADRAFT_66670 [Rhodotorula graminis WP1]KPV73804.1 hypothetical protein RHOBADRAFT_66670 [Rhodotorula graminis WP1]
MNAAALLESVKDAFYALAGSCCKTDATLKLNGRSFKVLRLLGEGGFSYVYLAQDNASKRLFALKKIRCPLGSDSVKAALKEVEAYKRFRHPNIIRCLDSCVVQDREGDGKVIYLFLPFYKNGTVQNVISANAVNGDRYPEKQMLSIFHGTCLAVRAMHLHQSGPSARGTSSSTRTSTRRPKMGAQAYPPQGRSDAEISTGEELDEFEEEDEDEESGGLRSGTNEGQALIGGLESARQQLEEDDDVPGMGEEDGATVLGRLGDGQRATGGTVDKGEPVEGQKGSFTPWAHRDIKPANVMLADDNETPVLMDFGSALPARIPIPDRRVALLQQDLAAEHCSMPFRAPELFDVKTGTTLTEAVDIWSLGCTLYAMAYGTSPFETTQQSEHGGSIAMAAMGGRFSFPDDGQYSESFRELVKAMIKVNPDDRPDISQVVAMTERALARLQ